MLLLHPLTKWWWLFSSSIDKCYHFRCVSCVVSETVEDVYSSLLDTRKKGRKTLAFEYLIERLDEIRKFYVAMELSKKRAFLDSFE